MPFNQAVAPVDGGTGSRPLHKAPAKKDQGCFETFANSTFAISPTEESSSPLNTDLCSSKVLFLLRTRFGFPRKQDILKQMSCGEGFDHQSHHQPQHFLSASLPGAGLDHLTSGAPRCRPVSEWKQEVSLSVA
jgi:hypothetical protein